MEPTRPNSIADKGINQTTSINHLIRKNTIISLLISSISYLYPVLVFVYIARILHPEGIGSATFASSVASIFIIFTGLGMPLYGLRSVAEKRVNNQELSELTAELLIVRFITGVMTWVLYLIITMLVSAKTKSGSLIHLRFQHSVCNPGLLMAL